MLLIGPILRFLLFALALKINRSADYAGEVVNILTISQIDAFAMGAPVAIFPKIKIKRPNLIFIVLLLFVVLVGGLNLISLKYNNNISDNIANNTFGYPWLMLSNFQYVWGYSLLNILFGFLIWNIVNGKNPFFILSNSFLIYIGKISYGIYIFHVPVLVFVKKV